MSLRIVLQARTSSQRLPGKVLLPIGGLPLAILCAKRLARDGAELVLATSDQASDGELVATAGEHGIAVFAGELDNVARRFAACTADLPDDAVIVRATADNPVPDSEVVRAFVADFTAGACDYLGPSAYAPIAYGLGVEVFRLGAFRASLEALGPTWSGEHVTTGLLANNGPAVADPARFALGVGREDVRVTVDTLDDYLVAARAFRAIGDPVRAGWRAVAAEFVRARSGDNW